MTLAFALTLFALGLVGAFVSGLLGVGGAIVMIPLLLYGPPALGVGQLDVKSVAGITMVLVLLAAASGVVAHQRTRSVHSELAWVGGLTMAAGSLTGAIGSKFVSDRVLLIVFAAMATIAVGLTVVPTETVGQPLFAEQVHFSRRRAIIVCLGVGLVAGLVGAGGAFLLVPLLMIVVGVPIRVTIGSSLAITALAALAGFTGKLATGQIPFLPAVFAAAGAVPGAQLGALVSHRLSGRRLKQALFVIVLVSAVRVWWDLLLP
ncbi:MAG TPA: sulfite exporter TauE/SafE family protein [Methylomirabilota bacterium]|nr:sulfite exporter TauE/SafE family protein [Methylomirabilota bacterium]